VISLVVLKEVPATSRSSAGTNLRYRHLSRGERADYGPLVDLFGSILDGLVAF